MKHEEDQDEHTTQSLPPTQIYGVNDI